MNKDLNITSATTTQFNNIKITAYCKCKKCGYDKAEVDTSAVYTSDPPKYGYYCPECGEHGYIYTSEAYGIATINKEEPVTYRESDCLICGKTIDGTFGEPAICDECKEAIKWAKEQKQDWKKAFELTKAQEEVSKITIHSKPFWCDQPCSCAECKKAVECAERYNEQHIKTKEIDATHLDLKELDKLRHDCGCLGKYEKLEAINNYYDYLTSHDNCLAEENEKLKSELKKLSEHITDLAKENCAIKKENLDLKIALAREDDRRKKNIGKK